MPTDVPLVDLSPALRLMGLALVIALLPLSWLWLRQRRADTPARFAALAALTLFLTFDLVVFGAFTRLSDSGLGCPDWPGCYGEVTPFGAREEIHAAQTALPHGPVTWSKAWIEMIHRYLAMTVGVLILVMAAAAWAGQRRLAISPWWPTLTLVWVVVQGLFGKYTVTLKLYPAVVTAHLLGGLLLLALLAVQHVKLQRAQGAPPLSLTPATRVLLPLALAMLVLQVASGGWVSTNYAVLACTGFPACNGQWWPAMDWTHGFTLLRHLGENGRGGYLTHEALVAIQMAHRLCALAATAALATLAWRLLQRDPGTRTHGAALAALLVLQLASGLSNVVLGWPLVAALGHSAGAAALVLLLVRVLARSMNEAPAGQRRGVAGREVAAA